MFMTNAPNKRIKPASLLRNKLGDVSPTDPSVIRMVFSNARDADIPANKQHEILKRQQGQCFYCESLLTKYVLDHFIPRSRGGGNDIGNRVAACPSCDGNKGARIPTIMERAKLATQID